MTLVTICCLNHQLKFPIVWSSDPIGKERFKVCQQAHHRYFHFYGDTQQVDFFAWLYSYTDLKAIKNRIAQETKKMAIDNDNGNIDQFLKDWEYLANLSYFPEFFFSKPKELGFSTEKLVKRNAAETITLGILEDQLMKLYNFELVEPEGMDEDIEKRFTDITNQVKERYQACIRCQNIDRQDEAAFFKLIRKLYNTSILERKWLACLALHYYQINGIKNYTDYYNLIITFLHDNWYLIRKECYELLKTTIFFNPNLALHTIRNLLKDYNLNSNLYGISLLNDFDNFLSEILSDNNYYVILGDFKSDHKLHEKYYKEIIQLYQLAHQRQESIKNFLINRQTYWQKNIRWDNPLPNDIETYSLSDKIVNYRGTINLLRIIREPFRKKKKKDEL